MVSLVDALDEHAGPLCCSEPQAVFLVDYFLYTVTCLLLWRSRVLLPLKLLTVFLHELGHALAAWLVCGSVHGIEVHANQGGVTHWSVPAKRLKLAQHLVLPAGYLGSAAWGGLLLVACARPETTHAATFVLMFFLALALYYSMCGSQSEERDWTLPALSAGLLLLLSALLYGCYGTDWEYRDLLLNKVLLLVATMNTLFATYDIWEDCISRTIERSDAYKYAQLVVCATPTCIGVVWLLISLVMAAAMLAIALLWTPAGQPVRTLDDFSWFSWLCMAVPAAVLAAAVVFRLCCSQTYGGAVRVTRGVTLEKDDADDADTDAPLRQAPLERAAAAKQREEGAGDEDGVGHVHMTTGKHQHLAGRDPHAAWDDEESSDEGSSSSCP